MAGDQWLVASEEEMRQGQSPISFGTLLRRPMEIVVFLPAEGAAMAETGLTEEERRELTGPLAGAVLLRHIFPLQQRLAPCGTKRATLFATGRCSTASMPRSS